MALQYPVFFDMKGNNCLIVGGDAYAAKAAKTLLPFEAKITVISPTLCEELQELETQGAIRYIPRKYFRGDAATAYICVAASGHKRTNIDIAVECKSRHIPVNVESPSEYGTFTLPELLLTDDFVGAFSSDKPEVLQSFLEKVKEVYPDLWNSCVENLGKSE